MQQKTFSKILTMCLVISLFTYASNAQVIDSTLVEDSTIVTDSIIIADFVEENPGKDNRPVKDPFESGVILNNQTIVIPTAHTLEFIIQHRFGKLNSEEFDLFGLYAPSNIRIGLSFSVTEKFLIGIGTTKNNKLQDINLKYAILRQTRSGSMPISITYYGNAAIDLRKEVYPKNSNRLSYFHQVIFARKFSDRVSVQLSPSYSHFNMVDSLVVHGNIGLSLSGRVKVSDVLGVIFEYDHNFTDQKASAMKVMPNLSLGLEAATSSHVFQVFVGTFESIENQHNFLYNTNDFTKRDVLIGFNITRLWNF